MKNNAEQLRTMAAELIQNTKVIAKQTGLSFDAALDMTIREFARQNPGKSELYYRWMIRKILNTTHPRIMPAKEKR